MIKNMTSKEIETGLLGLTVRDRIYVSSLLRSSLPVPSHLVREMKDVAKRRNAHKAKLRLARKTQSALYGNVTKFI